MAEATIAEPQRIYHARRGARVSDADAKVIGEALDQLGMELGKPFDGLDAADIVEAAADPTSPLHRYFEWDDDEAAHQWRLAQARHLARCFEVEVVARDAGPSQYAMYQAPAYYHVQIRDEEGDRVPLYVRSEEVASNPILMGQLIEQAKRDLHAYMRRHALIRSLPGITEVYAAAEGWLNGSRGDDSEEADFSDDE